MARDVEGQVPRMGFSERMAELAPEKRALLNLHLSRRLVSGHELLGDALKRLGITHVYTLPGNPIYETVGHLASSGIRVIGVRHQQSAVMMAAAHNYLRSRPVAVVVLSPGPGVTNAATGLLVAHDNGWPVLILGSSHPRSLSGSGAFQELDGAHLFQTISKWVATVPSVSALRECIERGFAYTVKGRPGPVYVDIPEDVLTERGRDRPAGSEMDRIPAGPGNDIAQAVDVLSSAERPLLIAGKGARWSDAYRVLQEFVDDFGFPFVTSPMGRGLLPDEHRNCCNAASGVAQRGADVVLLAGARLDWTFRFGAEIDAKAQIVQIDIEPEEIGRNRTPCIGLVGDLKPILLELRDGLRRARNRPDLDAWHDRLRTACGQAVCGGRTIRETGAKGLQLDGVLAAIRDVLPEDVMTVLDGNLSMAAAQRMLPVSRAVSRLTAGSNGCMGVGVPFGIAARLADAERPVVILSGDVAFNLNAMELETAVRHDLPLVVVVLDNGGNGGSAVQRMHLPQHHERITTTHPGIRYDRIMDVFGGHGEYVADVEAVAPAVTRALAAGRVAVVHVRLDPDEAHAEVL